MHIVFSFYLSGKEILFCYSSEVCHKGSIHGHLHDEATASLVTCSIVTCWHILCIVICNVCMIVLEIDILLS